MNRIAAISIGSCCLFVAVLAVSEAQHTASEAAAMKALDEFMAAFNSRDPKAWAATLNYPHVRFASGTVRVWETEKDFAGYMDFDAFAERFGWDHSAWDSRKIFQSGENKVHIAVQFSRYDKENEKISTYESLYIVTQVDGHWGTQSRSSFAP